MLQSTHLKNFLLLHHPHRQVVLEALQTGPHSLLDLVALLYNTQQTEHHLGKLQKAGLVKQDAAVYVLALDRFQEAQQKAQHPWLEKNRPFFQLLEQAFDENGVLRALPQQNNKKRALLEKLSLLFAADQKYTEKEVNALLLGFTRDPFLLRRSLIDAGLLSRTPSGSQYWRETHVPEI
ncbi:DUF2087 domain-containing protein [Deinococcus roseus]|uniref:DUF2087 domain-containing protein n=1 Tax=Deinococcus roseus TaxID=392414 RepID=A0ABQ2D8L3_9DEIO|nr:DUF2087 domain-containing protein [Deinococcus roseus]GGJ49885.1 hypothetical protein GCM10008938_39800 [Deinococcus roseus]